MLSNSDHPLYLWERRNRSVTQISFSCPTDFPSLPPRLLICVLFTYDWQLNLVTWLFQKNTALGVIWESCLGCHYQWWPVGTCKSLLEAQSSKDDPVCVRLACKCWMVSQLTEGTRAKSSWLVRYGYRNSSTRAAFEMYKRCFLPKWIPVKNIVWAKRTPVSYLGTGVHLGFFSWWGMVNYNGAFGRL